MYDIKNFKNKNIYKKKCTPQIVWNLANARKYKCFENKCLNKNRILLFTITHLPPFFFKCIFLCFCFLSRGCFAMFSSSADDGSIRRLRLLPFYFLLGGCVLPAPRRTPWRVLGASRGGEGAWHLSLLAVLRAWFRNLRSRAMLVAYWQGTEASIELSSLHRFTWTIMWLENCKYGRIGVIFI